ncbi:MAG: 3-deoxy-7-phosphoheptulonate synthase [Candidatus Gracilibacteria bacterium]|nr:3-deoxy-7-phosphoheptulonate synthase [Candidatus Gracilibacteria bacterium]
MKKIITPNQLKKKLVLSEKLTKNIENWRETSSKIIHKKNKKILVIVGPCSIHNYEESLFYAKKLNKLKKKVPNLFLVMRTYFEKPRTTIGWKGFINDPNLDGSYEIEKGLKKARKLLIKINDMGIPVSTEFLDPFTPNYISDLITWGAIGARTTESQIHRELASNLDSIIGFKNGTTGDIQIAIDAIKSSNNPHTFLGINNDGKTEILKSKGNDNCHIILRGGKNGPNYYEKDVNEASLLLKKEKIKTGIMIDASHSNSNKNPENQAKVIKEIAKQIIDGNREIIGVMIESNIFGGNQSFVPGVDDAEKLKYGVSITDGCISFEETEKILKILNDAIDKIKTAK